VGHLGCFHSLAIVNSAAINIGVQVLLCPFILNLCYISLPRTPQSIVSKFVYNLMLFLPQYAVSQKYSCFLYHHKCYEYKNLILILEHRNLIKMYLSFEMSYKWKYVSLFLTKFWSMVYEKKFSHNYFSRVVPNDTTALYKCLLLV
jgi:hypothetical protein